MGRQILRFYRLQEYNGLILRSMPKSQPGTFGHILGASHGAARLAAIRSFGRRGVRVQADECMR